MDNVSIKVKIAADKPIVYRHLYNQLEAFGFEFPVECFDSYNGGETIIVLVGNTLPIVEGDYVGKYSQHGYIKGFIAAVMASLYRPSKISLSWKEYINGTGKVVEEYDFVEV